MKKRLPIIIVALAASLALTGCGSMYAGMAGLDSRVVDLDNGGTIECVVTGGQNGGTSIDCVEATYVAPDETPITE